MKKYFILSLMIFMAFGVHSALALDVSPAGVSGGKGDAVSIPIHISNSGSAVTVSAFSFLIDFDDTVLTFVEADTTGSLTATLDDVSGKVNPSDSGQVKITGIAMFGTPANIASGASNELFLNLKFNVKDVANKNSSLVLSAFKDDLAGALSTSATFTLTDLTPGIPTEVNAQSSSDSIKISWYPPLGAYITGYNVYRSSTGASGSFSKINTDLVEDTYYIDSTGLVEKQRYYYQITSVDAFGNESPASETFSVVFAVVKLFIPNSNGSTGAQVRLPINIGNADALNVCGADIYVTYDPAVLTASGVEKSVLTADYFWAINTATPGKVIITTATLNAAPLYGEGALFYVLFDVIGDPDQTSDLEFTVDVTQIYNCPYLEAIPLDLTDAGVFTVDSNFILGDVDGDGDVDNADVQLVLNIKAELDALTEYRLQAGDVNGDGKITAQDAGLILRIIAGLPLAPTGSQRRSARSSVVNVSIPNDASVYLKNSAWVPVEISDATDIKGIDIIVDYDPTLVTASEARLTSLTENFNAVFNFDEAGRVIISMSAKDTDTVLPGGPGTLLEINFSAPYDTALNNTSPIRIAEVRLNDDYSRDFASSALQLDIQKASGVLSVEDIPYDMGDIDHSGSVGLGDAIKALQICAGISAEVYPAQDVNDDYRIGIEEALYALQVAAAIIIP